MCIFVCIHLSACLTVIFVFSGNEVHIVINTDTEYEKKEKKNHFGVKCKLIGYEWPNIGKEVCTVCYA